jgi:hypothetical protein
MEDIEQLSPQSLTLLLKAIIRVDLLRSPDSPPSLPWEELRDTVFPGLGNDGPLRFTQALQLALARAAHEKWSVAQLEGHLSRGGLGAPRVAVVGGVWGKERESVLAAVAGRGFSPLPTLQGAPTFSISTATASSSGTIGGEPLGMLSLEVSSGALRVEVSRGALGAAVTALGQARAALGAMG